MVSRLIEFSMSSLFPSALVSSGRQTSRFFTGLRCLEPVPEKGRPVSSRRSHQFHTVVAALVASAFVASSAAAQSCSSAADISAAKLSWNSPLDRRVSLHARDISLREALDRVSAATGIRLSYTSEAIPLDSRICAGFDSLALGEALGLLVRGAQVLPI